MMALSQCSYHIQQKLVEQFPEYKDAIEAKLLTLLPPQELLVEKIENKGLSYEDDEIFTFIYVGRNYFRKGGRDTVEVLARLHKEYEFNLILISALDKDEIKYERTNHDLEDAQKLIESNSDWIEYYPTLPNEQVLEKTKHSHVALLPTWMDTFAYSVLECQACGTPVISTSLRALTELNGKSVGWLIDVPVNNLNNPIMNNRADFVQFEKQLQAGLEQKVRYVLEHRQEVRVKAVNCIKKIRKENDPATYNECLKLLYQGEVDKVRMILKEQFQ